MKCLSLTNTQTTRKQYSLPDHFLNAISDSLLQLHCLSIPIRGDKYQGIDKSREM